MSYQKFWSEASQASARPSDRALCETVMWEPGPRFHGPDAAERMWACIAQECRDEGLKHSGGSASTTAAAVARSSNAADESRRATAADFGLREKPGRRKK